MLIGSILLTSIWGVTLQGWVIGYAWCLFIYGVGVGGEYPMTSTKSLETGVSGPAGTRDDRLHRGRNVVGAFLMQGWGQVWVFSPFERPIRRSFETDKFRTRQQTASTKLFSSSASWSSTVETPNLPSLLDPLKQPTEFNSVSQSSSTSGSSTTVSGTSRTPTRNFELQREDKTSRDTTLNLFAYSETTTGIVSLPPPVLGSAPMSSFVCYWSLDCDTRSITLTLLNWTDGNKIFSSVFIGIIHPGASLVVTWEYNLLNTAISLVGYYLAMFLIDHKFYGRRRMQQVGFSAFLNLFLIFFHS